jgi:hypothetical protein
MKDSVQNAWIKILYMKSDNICRLFKSIRRALACLCLGWAFPANLFAGGGDLNFIFLFPATGPDSTVLSSAFQPDGKILIGGNFTTHNGVARAIPFMPKASLRTNSLRAAGIILPVSLSVRALAPSIFVGLLTTTPRMKI